MTTYLFFYEKLFVLREDKIVLKSGGGGGTRSTSTSTPTEASTAKMVPNLLTLQHRQLLWPHGLTVIASDNVTADCGFESLEDKSLYQRKRAKVHKTTSITIFVPQILLNGFPTLLATTLAYKMYLAKLRKMSQCILQWVKGNIALLHTIGTYDAASN